MARYADSGANREHTQDARTRGFEIFIVALYLQGEVLGDEPSAKRFQPIEADKAWRKATNEPPRTRPIS